MSQTAALKPTANMSRGTVRTSLSCAKPVYDQALEKVQRKGFRSFSNYVEFLIRLDQEPSMSKQ